jgi:hypothetical protein
MHERVKLLSAREREVLLLLGVAGTAVPIGSVGAEVPTADAWRELERRGYIAQTEEGWRVAHDELARLVIASATRRELADAHHRMAAVLEEAPQNSLPIAIRTARHWAYANEDVALDNAFVRVLERAGAERDFNHQRRLAQHILAETGNKTRVDDLVRRLPWRLRVGVLRPTLIMAIPLALATTVTLVVSRVPNEPSHESLFSMAIADDFGHRFVSARSDQVLSSTDQPVDLKEESPLLPSGVLNSINVNGRLPNGDFIGSAILTSDRRQGVDVVRVTPSGEVSTLIGGPHDQSWAKIAPNGRSISYLSGEWHPQMRAELAVYDIATKRSIRLTNTDAVEGQHAWSEDGSRIGFERIPTIAENSSLCTIVVASLRERCHVLPDSITLRGVVGWRANDRILAVVENLNTLQQSLIEAEVGDARLSVIDVGGSQYRSSPSGEEIVCVCVVNGYDSPVVALFNADRPRAKRTLRLQGKPITTASSSFFVWSTSRSMLSRIEASGPDSIDALEQARFSVRGLDASGRYRGVTNVSWSSTNENVLRHDSGAFFTAKAGGRAKVVALLTPEMSDTMEVFVRGVEVSRSGSDRTLVRIERWSNITPKDWINFGTPAPSTNNGSLLVNGDGHLFSGIVSVRAFAARRGLGLRAKVRIPVNSPQWQSLFVGFDYFAPPDTLAMWTRRTEGLPPSTAGQRSVPRSCAFWAPREEGGPFMKTSGFAAAGIPLALPSRARSITNGRWHEVILQIFSDGRCGLAIDREPMVVSQLAVITD